MEFVPSLPVPRWSPRCSRPTLARAADIVDTAVAAGSFNTLVTAVKAAGLVKTLKGKGPYTVFAPNDAAFAKLPPGTVESLLKNKAKLATILKYHVVPGRVKAADVAGKSLTGQDCGGATGECRWHIRREGQRRPRDPARHRSIERCHSCHRHGLAASGSSQEGTSLRAAPHLSFMTTLPMSDHACSDIHCSRVA